MAKILSTLLDSLFRGAAVEGAEVAVGDLLTALGLTETSGTEAQLQQLDTDLKSIEDDVKQLLNGIKEEEYLTIKDEIEGSANKIITDYTVLSNLKPDDATDIAALTEYWSDSTKGEADLSNVIRCMGNDAGGEGLLQAFIEWVSGEATTGDGYVRGDFGAASNLYKYYLQMQDYFTTAISLETKGAILVVNALNAGGKRDEADEVVAQVKSHIESQCELFLSLVEQYTANYCQDMLIDLFSDSEYQKYDSQAGYQGTDPVRLAGLFIDSILKADTLYARIWGGKGTGPYPFDTGTYLYTGDSQPPGNLADYIGLSGNVPPNKAKYSLFGGGSGSAGDSGSEQSQWCLYRFAWNDPNVAAQGRYSFTNGAANSSAFLPFSIGSNPICNVMVDQASGCMPYTYQNKTLDFETGTPRNSYYAVFTGVTELLLDGHKNYVKVDVNSAQRDVGDGDFSIEAWILPDSGTTGTIIGNDPISYQYNFRLAEGGTLQFSFTNKRGKGYGITTKQGAGPDLYDGNWHHVAAVRAGGVLQIYVDGQPAPSSVDKDSVDDLSGLNVSGTDKLYIGAKSYGGDNLDDYFQGRMIEVRLWKRALDQTSDIQANMCKHLKGNEEHLRGYWRMDNGNASDTSGNGDGKMEEGASIEMRMASGDVVIAASS